MGRKKRHPAVSSPPPTAGRQPVAAEDARAYVGETPLWCFRSLDARGCEWSWEDEENPALVIKALERLKALADTSWMTIEQENGRRSNGAIDVSKLATDAQNRIRELKLEQFDPFYHLRVTKRVRIWGYRRERVLHVVWLDRKHTVFPTLTP